MSCSAFSGNFGDPKQLLGGGDFQQENSTERELKQPLPLHMVAICIGPSHGCYFYIKLIPELDNDTLNITPSSAPKILNIPWNKFPDSFARLPDRILHCLVSMAPRVF